MSDIRSISESPSTTESQDEVEAIESSAARVKASAFALVLLALAIAFAGAGMSDAVSQRWSDISKVAAVALFVGAMVSLAMGMIGDAYHQK